MIKPLGFLEFLQIESQARLVLTDSGGVQEETCILNVPCVTLRESTRRRPSIQERTLLQVLTRPPSSMLQGDSCTIPLMEEPVWRW